MHSARSVPAGLLLRVFARLALLVAWLAVATAGVQAQSPPPSVDDVVAAVVRIKTFINPDGRTQRTCAAFPTLAIRDSVNLATGPARHSVPPYAEQVRCAHQYLDRLLAAVDQVAGPGRSIVIVQGDHGPRLGVTSRMTLASLGPRQVSSAFATLFAIRTPYSSGQVITGAVPIQDLFASFVAHDFTRANPGPWQQFVIGPPSRPGGSDTLRLLTAAETIWARPPSADSLTEVNPAYQLSGIR